MKLRYPILHRHAVMALFLLLLPCVLPAQELITLPRLIEMAQERSLRSKLANTRVQVSQYTYERYLSDLKPQITLYGNAPVYSKEYATVTQPDGTISFEPVRQMLNSFGVALFQKIPFTGGELSFHSDLNWFRNLQNKSNLYNGTPFYIRLNQPLFAVNPMKWQRKIEPLRLEESRRNYRQEQLSLSADATILYFNALEAQVNMDIAEANLANTAINLDIEKKRVNLGTTSEDKLLQLELQMLNSRQELEKARYNREIALLSIKNLLGRKDTTAMRFQIPGQLPELSFSLEESLDMAKKNRPEYIAFERQKLEAEREVAMANADSRQINIVASYGVNRADAVLDKVYTNPQSQQRFSLGFNIPIVDWGRRKNAMRTAEANQQLVLYTNEIASTNIDQEITTVHNNLLLLRKNIQLALVTDSVAERRYELSRRLYQMGKLSITELGISQQEKDNARRNYIAALRNFWETWQRLMRLTGYTGAAGE